MNFFDILDGLVSLDQMTSKSDSSKPDRWLKGLILPGFIFFTLALLISEWEYLTMLASPVTFVIVFLILGLLLTVLLFALLTKTGLWTQMHKGIAITLLLTSFTFSLCLGSYLNRKQTVDESGFTKIETRWFSYTDE